MNSQKVLFAINDLKTGGAQKTLLRVVKDLQSEYEVLIIVFDKLGPVGDELLKSGYRIEVIKVKSIIDKITFFYRLIKCMNSYRPTHVVTFLYFSDFIVGSIAKSIFPSVKVVWNIRNDVLKWNQTSLTTWVISRMNIFLSYLIPDKIIFVSQSSFENHAALGYYKNISKVILNNVDKNKFFYSEILRNAFRKKLQIEENTLIFGFAARYDKIKNINLFLSSIEHYYAHYCHADLFIVCGDGMSYDNIELMSLLRKYNLVDKVLLLGYLENIVEFYSGIDCIVSTSTSEGSPNNILEAIATGLYFIVPRTFDLQNCPNGKIVVEMRPDIYSAIFNKFSLSFKKKTIMRTYLEFDYPIKNKHNLAIYFNSFLMIKFLKVNSIRIFYFVLSKIYRFNSWHTLVVFENSKYMPEVVEIVSELDSDLLIELGCGLGEHLRRIDKTAIGIDIDNNVIKAARFLSNSEIDYYSSNIEYSNLDEISVLVSSRHNFKNSILLMINWLHNYPASYINEVATKMQYFKLKYVVIDIINDEIDGYKYKHKLRDFDPLFRVVRVVRSSDGIRNLVVLDIKQD